MVRACLLCTELSSYLSVVPRLSHFPPIRVGVAQYASQGLSLYFSSCRYKLIACCFSVPLPDFAGFLSGGPVLKTDSLGPLFPRMICL